MNDPAQYMHGVSSRVSNIANSSFIRIHCSFSLNLFVGLPVASYRGSRSATVELTLKTLGTGMVSWVTSPLAETTVTVGLDMVAVGN